MNISETTSMNERRLITDDPLFHKEFISVFTEWLPRHRDIVIACIGTDRSTGDSFGPFTGSMLEEQGTTSFHVIGTIEEPLHAMNLEERLTEVRKNFHRPFIIAIDACLGSVANIGSLSIAQGPLAPGAALKKDLPEVGDVHINGIVNVQGFMEFAVLQNTRLKTVLDLASATSSALLALDAQIKKERSPVLPGKTFTHLRRARLAKDA